MTDPLGVRTSCAAVVATSIHVRIDDEAIVALADELMDAEDTPSWDSDLHVRYEIDEHWAMWILVLDTLNFCFWADDPTRRWRVWRDGELVDGYVAIVTSLRYAAAAGFPLHDPGWLATISDEGVGAILAPAEGHTNIPLLDCRAQNLRELGRVLSAYGAQPASTFIAQARGSAVRFVQQLVHHLPSFNHVAYWPHAATGLPGGEVRFYKRAQILAGDLHGGLAGSPLVAFHDLDQLTAFADYKVPQILRALGILQYGEALTQAVDARQHLAPGSRMEVEIRAATIVACDRLVAALRARGRDILAIELDLLLWSRSQHLPPGARPYHLTESIFY